MSVKWSLGMSWFEFNLTNASGVLNRMCSLRNSLELERRLNSFFRSDLVLSFVGAVLLLIAFFCNPFAVRPPIIFLKLLMSVPFRRNMLFTRESSSSPLTFFIGCPDFSVGFKSISFCLGLTLTDCRASLVSLLLTDNESYWPRI